MYGIRMHKIGLDKIRSAKELLQFRDPKELPPQFHLPQEEAPSALLDCYALFERLQHPFNVPRSLLNYKGIEYFDVYIEHEYIVASLLETFLPAFERMLTRKASYSGKEVADLKARAEAVMPDIVGRLLYQRLYNIAAASCRNRHGFESPPKIDSNIELPTPLARAISGIGIFRPAGVFPPIVIFPTYGTFPDDAGGCATRCQSRAYAKLFLEFAKCGIATSKVETRECDGTSWYLLGARKTNARKEYYDLSDDVYEVVASFPLENGNVSVTDAIARTYCLHRDRRPFAHDTRVRRHLYSDDYNSGPDFGIVMADINPKFDPTEFMEADMAENPESVIKAGRLGIDP